MAVFRLKLCIFFLAFALPFPIAASDSPQNQDSDSFSVVTYNIHIDNKMDEHEQAATFFQRNVLGLGELMRTNPDVVNLQEVPLAGVRWLKKTYGNTYALVYAPMHIRQITKQRNGNTVILYKKSRFEALDRSNANPRIRTKYFSNQSGHFVLIVEVKDLKTGLPVALVNTHLVAKPFVKWGSNQTKEIIQYLQGYPYAVVAGDFKGTKEENRMINFSEYGFIHDPVTESTFPSKGKKIDHILFKGSGQSKFLSEACHIESGIKGSDHYPLTCRVYLR